ncbi:MAG: type II toxin-antitoxin system VapC family toxin [Acidobacteria bacterium]|nr:type II toxin-antitoxin system VapC family toxin [Acidobacteriota bacterium]
MIFVDSNIPMYLVGAEHRNKDRAEQLLRRLIEAREKLVTDVEVFQEILHRYVAIRRHDAIEAAWRALHGLVDDVFPIALPQVDDAKSLVLESQALSARDALHVAVMRAHGVEEILTFDTGFDTVADLSRIH